MDSKLAAILNKSKQVMNRTEELTPLNSPNGYMPAVGLHENKQYTQPQYQQPQYTQPAPQPYMDPGVGPRGVGGKNLPPQIREMMESNPSTYNPTGSINPTLDLEMEKYRQQLQMESVARQPQQIPTNGDYVLVSQKELKAMINESLKSFLTQFKGKIEEATIKKTLNILLKEQKRG